MDFQKIPLDSVKPSPMNPRKTFDDEAVNELAANIEKQGLIQPITVRPRIVQIALNEEVTDGYEIVCGERRYRAFSLLKAKEDEAVSKKAQPLFMPFEISILARCLIFEDFAKKFDSQSVKLEV